MNIVRLHFLSARLPQSERPYFTPGFPLALPLEHKVRIGSLDARSADNVSVSKIEDPIVSDTGELRWYTQPIGHGVVTVDTDRTQALIGFIKSNPKSVKHLSVDLTTQFATLVLTSLDSQPIADSSRMLLTAGSRVANIGMKWDASHRRLAQQGTAQGAAPTLIEPVTGTVTLREIRDAVSVSAVAMDGSGCAMGKPIAATKTIGGWSVRLGNPVTTWYVISVKRQQG